MHQRFTTHITTGVGAPSALEAQSHSFIPQLGGALFAGAAKAATALAKKEVSRAVRQVRTTSSKELRRKVADWFIVESLLSSLATEATLATPAPLKQIARKALRAHDQWGAFAVLGAWQLRECSTTRVAPQDMPSSPNVGARKLSRKRSRVTRRSIQTLVSAYEAARRGPLAAYAEHQKHDPLAKFREAVARFLGAHQKAQARTFPALVRASMDQAWPTHSSFFLGIPFEARLGLTLSMLIKLRADHTVWTHQIDFVIEPLLRSILREARRLELARQFRSMSSTALAEVAAAVTAACAYATAMDIATMLTVGTTSNVLAPALQDAITTAANAHVAVTEAEVLNLVGAVDGSAFDAASRALRRKWNDAIISDLRKLPIPPEGLAYAEGVAASEPSPVDGDEMMKLLLGWLPHGAGDVVSGVSSNSTTVMSAAATEVASCFRAPPKWAVALPIENWAADSPPPASPGSRGPLMTIEELEATWHLPQQLALAAVSGGPRARISKSSLCLVADEVVAPTDQLAVREAQARLDADLCGLWFLGDRSYSARLSTDAFVCRSTDGRLTRVGISGTNLFPCRSARPDELQALGDIAETLAARRRDPHQQDMWRRVSEGMGFLRSAFSTTLFYERYLFLWMALEALLNNLAVDDDEKYARAAPIGTRVAYRAALLLVPDPAMTKRTYGEARWVTTLELGALYHLRNKAVHEGRRNPPMDEIILDRFQRRVVAVFETISHNAFCCGMRRIEELLAWCEDKCPDADPMP